MINKTSFKSLLLLLLLISAINCTKIDDVTDLDINKDPNSPTEASIELLLPQAQLDFVDFINGLNYTQLGITGILSSGDAYGYNPDDFAGSWDYFYTGAGKDIEEIIKAATASKTLNYLGIAQIMKAYSFGVLVDLFGSVPFREAFLGNAKTPNFQPKFDEGSLIYDSCLSLCNQAIANLSATSSFTLKNDLFYANSKASWIRLAKSVKIRLLLNSRKARPNAAADLQSAFAGEYIGKGLVNSTAQDFTFKYTTKVTPDQRHPWYQSAYGGASNGFSYFLTQYMGDMLLRKDPRFNFYFRRQTTKLLDQNVPTEKGATPERGGYLVYNPDFWNKAVAAGVLKRTKADSQYLAGIFGRVRGDITGVPDDADYRIVPGCYPAAGLYDDKTITPSTIYAKGSGAGIFPLITSNIMNFWLVEAQLAYSFGQPRVTFEKAIRESILNVINFAKSVDPNGVKTPTDSVINVYVTNSLREYDLAPSNEAKLNYVLYEAWFANIANGFENYNALRRTGYPSRVLAPATGKDKFALRLPIPATEGDYNKNIPKPIPGYYIDPVFWDKVKFRF